MSEYERLCAVAERQVQELLRDHLVVEYHDGSLTLASEIEDIAWSRASIVTVLGPDGLRRKVRRPQS